jgi:hypothetical protein
VCTIGLTLGLKFKSEDRGVIYQTKGKDLIYTSMQSLGSHLLVEQDLTIRDRNPETRCYSSRVDKRRLNLIQLYYFPLLLKSFFFDRFHRRPAFGTRFDPLSTRGSRQNKILENKQNPGGYCTAQPHLP